MAIATNAKLHVWPVAVWQGCYEERWNRQIVPEAYAHPAKVAPILLSRIFDELLDRGWLRRGQIVLDPFGGIGTTAIAGTYRGVRVVCHELEPEYVRLARLNVDLHDPRWRVLGYRPPAIVHGDSRELAASLGYIFQCDAVISSPPYGVIAAGAGGLNTKPAKRAGQQAGRSPRAASQSADQRYGHIEGQMARMSKPDFLAAARQTVEQVARVLKPGGVAAWIVKGFVQDGALVDFPQTWRGLCEAAGFAMLLEVQASFVDELRRPSLFGGDRVERRERKGFFRRLAELKGAPRIDFETVLFMRLAG